MIRLRNIDDERGFSLVEVMAALLVFALVTVALVPLLATSMRAATLGNSYAIGKNLTVQGMERIRGLPYYISYSAQNRKVDVLDLYFPNTTSATAQQSYSATSPAYTFTTTCTSATTSIRACPKDVPSGYTVKFEAQFVTPVDSGTTTTAHTPTQPAIDYRWDPPVSSPTADQPPTQLLKVSVSTSWQVAGRDKSFSLISLVSDRPFGTTKVSGNGEIAYGVQVLTAYKDPAGGGSDLIATGGSAQSQIGTRQVSTASQTVDAGGVSLAPTPTDPSFTPVEGARTAYQAPPNQTAAGVTVTCPNGTPNRCELRHPDLGGVAVAGMTGTTADNIQVGISNELPMASGRFSYSQSSLLEDLWVNPQEPFDSTGLRLGTGHMFSLRPRTSGGQQGLTGSTSAVTTALTSGDRSVTTTANVSLRDLRVLPTKYIGSSPGTVLWIDEFSATTTCKATGATTAPDPTATWSARLYYWKDSNPADNVAAGSYVQVNLGGNLASDPLAALTGTGNPLVYDGPDAASDIYLFKTSTKRGYLTSASSLYNVSTVGISKDSAGRTRSASIGGALRIDTAPVNADPAAFPASSLGISLGSLECEAVDKR